MRLPACCTAGKGRPLLDPKSTSQMRRKGTRKVYLSRRSWEGSVAKHSFETKCIGDLEVI